MKPHSLLLFSLITSAVVGEGHSSRKTGALSWGTMGGNEMPQDSVGTEVFRRQCAPCHGNEGKGNGPAAVAFNPPPADLTDSARIGLLGDEELVAVIGNGRASMPAFAPLLSPEELQAVAAYVRRLSEKRNPPETGQAGSNTKHVHDGNHQPIRRTPTPSAGGAAWQE